MKKVITTLFVVVFAIAAIAPMALAQSTVKGDDPVKDTANYSGNVVTGSVNTVGAATEGTAETAVSPIVAFWRAITGQGKPDKVITDPIEKGGKTIIDGTISTGKILMGEKVEKVDKGDKE